jgi:hypothetical protein
MIRKLVVSLVPCVALVACVQVLGLEEAALEEGAGGNPSPPPSSEGRSRISCEAMPEDGRNCACEDAPSADCTLCLNTCGSAVEACTAQNKCRQEIDAYALCLGRSCGGDQEDCAAALTDPAFQECVIGCADQCRRTQLVTQCELFCACMGAYCDGEIEPGECMTVCQDLDGDVRDCRRRHCELGRGGGFHCQHASGRMPSDCATLVDRPAEERTFCLDARETGWPCDENSQCCSLGCRSGSCE